jgi:hypothetical protein
MSKMKNWMMDMEELIEESIAINGVKNENDVLAYVKTNMAIVDEKFVKEYTTKILGEF